jgi:HD-GYP domain-containing protein (c-di-GMP phosphodiesterase class II)
MIINLSPLLTELRDLDSTSADYYPVDINKLNPVGSCPCDLYIRLSERKFVKCVRSGDEFDLEIQTKYRTKTTKLWVIKDDFFEYSDFIFGKVELEKKITNEFSISNLSDIELIHDMARSCGISGKTLRTVESQVQELQENSKGNLKKLLVNFEEMKGTFLYSHSYFTSLIAIEAAKKQSWFKHQHIDKLVLASILHDLGFKDSNSALYESLPKSKILELPAVIQKDLLNHVDKICELLKIDDGVDSDVLNIIFKHHGGRGEESYPLKSFGTEIDLLSGIFLLSHAFTLTFYTVAFNKKKLKEVFLYLEHHYNKGNLRKIFPLFKESILDIMK